MALMPRWFVETNTSDSHVSAGRWQSESIHDTFESANEEAVFLVAHGKAKDGVRVTTGYQFDDSHEIEPANDEPVPARPAPKPDNSHETKPVDDEPVPVQATPVL